MKNPDFRIVDITIWDFGTMKPWAGSKQIKKKVGGYFHAVAITLKCNPYLL